MIQLNSTESLDDFLPLYHTQDEDRKVLLNKEREIVIYLKNLGLKMKTDPIKKLEEYYSSLTIQGIEFATSPEMQTSPLVYSVTKNRFQNRARRKGSAECTS
ncbi:hypothetical protein pb186bvf_003494 [Paramecium bursaria]